MTLVLKRFLGIKFKLLGVEFEFHVCASEQRFPYLRDCGVWLKKVKIICKFSFYINLPRTRRRLKREFVQTRLSELQLCVCSRFELSEEPRTGYSGRSRQINQGSNEVPAG